MYIILVLIAVQTFYWFVLNATLFFHRDKSTISEHKVSILICAKNEATNLKNNLPLWINQNDSNFEIVVVNDFSIDESQIILDQFIDNITVVTPSEDQLGKKLALSNGIKACTGTQILLTDSDCVPATKYWVKNMRFSSDNTNLKLGHGPFRPERNWVNRFARFENLLTAIQYLSFAKLGMPYMGVGRNLSYSKELFEKYGLSNHRHIVSGDDDLFVQEARKTSNVEVSLNPEGFMYSPSKLSLSDYIIQKKRHLSTSVNYSTIHKLILSINPALQITIYLILLIFILSGLWSVFFTLLGIKWFVQMLIFVPSSFKLRASILHLFPIVDFLFFIYLIYFIPAAFANKSKTW